jgi:hypothetical protein
VLSNLRGGCDIYIFGVQNPILFQKHKREKKRLTSNPEEFTGREGKAID